MDDLHLALLLQLNLLDTLTGGHGSRNYGCASHDGRGRARRTGGGIAVGIARTAHSAGSGGGGWRDSKLARFWGVHKNKKNPTQTLVSAPNAAARASAQTWMRCCLKLPRSQERDPTTSLKEAPEYTSRRIESALKCTTA